MRNHDLVFFESPIDLMKHIAAHYRDLRISRGIITLSIKFSNALRPKQVTLNINEKRLIRLNSSIQKWKR